MELEDVQDVLLVVLPVKIQNVLYVMRIMDIICLEQLVAILIVRSFLIIMMDVIHVLTLLLDVQPVKDNLVFSHVQFVILHLNSILMRMEVVVLVELLLKVVLPVL